MFFGLIAPKLIYCCFSDRDGTKFTSQLSGCILRGVLYGRKKKIHFAGKMDFLAKGKKSYYTENGHLKNVILSKQWFSQQKFFFSVIMGGGKPLFWKK